VREVSLEPVAACRHEVLLQPSPFITTSRAPYDHVYVTTGFMRFAGSDAMLAAGIAHELAHRVLGGSGVATAANEIRADRLALELAGRAGYDVSVTPSLWERLALEHPTTIVPERGYPAHGRVPERMPALHTESRRIRDQRPRSAATDDVSGGHASPPPSP
jgi:predicted Zn-dependent protease